MDGQSGITMLAVITLVTGNPLKSDKYFYILLGWDAGYFLSLAAKIGENSVVVFKKILASKEFIEQTYRACLGMKRLSEIYGTHRFEAACKRVENASRVTYGMIKNILEKNLDKQTESQLNLFPIPNHENIRGPGHYH